MITTFVVVLGRGIPGRPTHMTHKTNTVLEVQSQAWMKDGSI